MAVYSHMKPSSFVASVGNLCTKRKKKEKRKRCCVEVRILRSNNTKEYQVN